MKLKEMYHFENVQKIAQNEAWRRLIDEIKLKEWRGKPLCDRSLPEIARCIETWFKLQRIPCSRNHTFIEVSDGEREFIIEVSSHFNSDLQRKTEQTGGSFVAVNSLSAFFRWFDKIFREEF